MFGITTGQVIERLNTATMREAGRGGGWGDLYPEAEFIWPSKTPQSLNERVSVLVVEAGVVAMRVALTTSVECPAPGRLVRFSLVIDPKHSGFHVDRQERQSL